MPEGKKLLQLGFIGLSAIALFCSMLLSCILHDKDPFLGTVGGVACVGFISYMCELWD